ncbi:unnamed protein product [Paramecium sonneborni]|uniref:WD40-repeat-containing domain n=1 Tax=Paramecium sonneborni TaxID=65129 RepID=A0A8S1RPC1_9CILI|nr:unnamed protein product [Paramecium sonneborni]
MNFHKKNSSNKFSFQPINSGIIKHSQVCKAIAINNNNKFILGSFEKIIKFFQFDGDQIKQIKFLTMHKKIITNLTICKQKPNYQSSSKDGSIQISSFLLSSSPKYLQRLQEHKKEINCLILHPRNENLFVSGCDDGAIIFWNCINNQWQKNQIINNYQGSYLGDIYGLSINPEKNEIISCTHRSQIIVMKQQNENKLDSFWKITQIIKDGFGYRIGFITSEIFVFQPRSSSKLLIYKLDQNDNYQQIQDLQVQGGNQPCGLYFPIFYILQKKFFLSKNGHCINIIIFNQQVESKKIMKKIEQDQAIQENCFNFELAQTIEIKQAYWGEIYGVVSNDGKYLIIWSDSQRQILISKYIENNILSQNY